MLFLRDSQRKPAQGAELDLGHPLARGLQTYLLMNEGAGNYIRDYVSGRKWTLGNPSSANVTWATDPYLDGPAVKMGGSGNDCIWSVDAYPLDFSKTFSVMGRAFSTSGNRTILFGQSNTGNCIQLEFQSGAYGTNNAGVIIPGIYRSGTGDGLYVQNKWIDYVYSFHGNGVRYGTSNNGHAFYANGRRASTNGDGALGGEVALEASCRKQFGSRGGDLCFYGLMSLGAIWTRALSDDEVLWLREDPFCMFTERRATHFFLPPYVIVEAAPLQSVSSLPQSAISRPGMATPVPLASNGLLPAASGTGIRPFEPPPPPVHGDSVSFRQFTLGWSDLRRLMKVNEQDTAMPGATFVAAGVGATAGGQYVGVFVPAIQTADLATAWERETRQNAGGNYVF